ncbi:hypothetical protein TPY_3109 [Sulfobacillus acidophilus TPY]|nr:hypothetical protein TPY_3109 [Sulfobacillus acidophilus TPY]
MLRIFCAGFAEASGVFIIKNPDWDPEYDPDPSDELPPFTQEPPVQGCQYTLTNGRTYMPTLPFLWQSVCAVSSSISRLLKAVRRRGLGMFPRTPDRRRARDGRPFAH